jgi:hypothetical protein
MVDNRRVRVIVVGGGIAGLCTASSSCPAAPTRPPQLANPLGWRLRNAIVRRLPDRAQRRRLEPLVRYQL